MKEKLKAAYQRFRWTIATWRHVPPWTKALVRYSLTRHQSEGDNDWRANVAWNVAKLLTWDRISMQRYAMNCLVYGTHQKS
jgi:hypothetical protein